MHCIVTRIVLVPIGSSTTSVQQHKKSEKKWKRELKSLRKNNNMLYSISKKSGSLCEIKKIGAKSSKKASVSSSED